MIALNDNKVSVVLDSCQGLEDVSILKNALLNILINIDVTNHSETILEDVIQVAQLLKSLDLNYEQCHKIHAEILTRPILQKEINKQAIINV